MIQLPASKSFFRNIINNINKNPLLTAILALLIIGTIIGFIFMIIHLTKEKKNDTELFIEKLKKSDFKLDKKTNTYSKSTGELTGETFPMCIYKQDTIDNIKILLGFDEEDKVIFTSDDPALIGDCVAGVAEQFSDYNDFQNEEEEEDSNEGINTFQQSNGNDNGCFIKSTDENNSYAYFYYSKCPDGAPKDNTITDDIKESRYGEAYGGTSLQEFKLCGKNPTDIIPYSKLKEDNFKVIYNDVVDTDTPETELSKYKVIPDNELDNVKQILKNKKVEINTVYHKNKDGKCIIPNSEANSRKKKLIKNNKRHFQLILTLNEKKIKAEYK